VNREGNFDDWMLHVQVSDLRFRFLTSTYWWVKQEWC